MEVSDDVSAFVPALASSALCVVTAILIISNMGNAATHIVNSICLKLTRPINNNSSDVAPVSSAFDKLAGMINIQVNATGIINGKKPFLKSFITSCFRLNCRDKYINSASFAKSLV